MTAHRWHQASIAMDVKEPDQLTATELNSASPEVREQYAAQVKKWYRTQFFTTPDREAIARQLSETVRANDDSLPGARTFMSVTGPNGALSARLR